MFDVKKGNGSINHRRSQRAKAVKLVGTTDLQFEMEGIIVGESPHITKIVVKAQGKLAMKELTFEFFFLSAAIIVEKARKCASPIVILSRRT